MIFAYSETCIIILSMERDYRMFFIRFEKSACFYKGVSEKRKGKSTSYGCHS